MTPSVHPAAVVDVGLGSAPHSSTSLSLQEGTATSHKTSLMRPCLDRANTPAPETRVEKSYRRLQSARVGIEMRSQAIAAVLDRQTVTTVPRVIIGGGDIGTSVWLEQYKEVHGTGDHYLAQHRLLSALIIDQGSCGNWGHDYLLAQTGDFLHRAGAANPSDYVSPQSYASNRYSNARHLRQANDTNLGTTQAPVLKGWNVLTIEKKENHLVNWQNPAVNYRIVMQNAHGQKKTVYTDQIDVCTGLGPAANNLVPKVIAQADFNQLNQYDAEKGFTPITSGNDFILTKHEEGGPGRTIVVYGGGGTATACFRKGFFGDDIGTQERPYTPENQKNTAYLIAKSGFSLAGGGKIVGDATRNAQKLDRQFVDELLKIQRMPNGKMLLSFSSGREVECDQLVYCTGQNDPHIKEMCREIKSDIVLNIDSSETPLGLRTVDHRVRCFGGAAINLDANKVFAKTTTDWLQREHVGLDAVAGTMPPTRAQIKKAACNNGALLTNVNTNTDDLNLIKQFLLQAGVDANIASSIILDILDARTYSSAGLTRPMLQNILEQNHIADKVRLYGHSCLVFPSNHENMRQLPAHNLPQLSRL